MRVDFGKGRTQYGTGVDIRLSGDELAQAILDYVRAHGVVVEGPRTVTVRGELCSSARVYVDPSGRVVDASGAEFSGRGPAGAPSERGANVDV